jgi:D-tyrosyl-tRNA(Tyr) deacylase
VITIVQRVSSAAVRVDGADVGRIGKGLMLLVGVESGDTEQDADATTRKIAALRIFQGKTPMDLSVKDVSGGCLVISQFTLAASLHGGNRPSFEGAEDPVRARALYERVAQNLAQEGLSVATGQFGASMSVELTNEGPVTLIVIARRGVLVKYDPQL